MNRIRCIQLFASMDLAPVAMAEALLRRDCGPGLCDLAGGWDKPRADRWKKETVPHIIMDAAAAVQRFIDGEGQAAALEADQVRRHLTCAPCLDELAEAVTSTLNEERLHQIAEEARERIKRRSELEWHELHMALVPFTASCEPELTHARECWCGCWIEVGIGICPFCGDASPTGRPTRVWKREPCMEDQLEAHLKHHPELEPGRGGRMPARDRIPQGTDLDEYINEAESYDYPDGEGEDEFDE